MSYAILTNSYPSEEEKYSNGFIHSRVKIYLQQNLDLKVFVINNHKTNKKYEYEGVVVFEGKKEFILKKLKIENPKKILCHFINKEMMNIVSEIDKETLIWIHGVEALGWWRRLFNIKEKKFYRYIISNTRQLYNLRKFIKNNKKIHLIFVSKWMKDILEKDINLKIKSYSIIPNVVDTSIFTYQKKNIELRKKILLIRPFKGYKYANDIAIKGIKELAKWERFEELNIDIYGDGKDFEKLTSELKKYKNISLNKTFLTHKEIARLHENHGIILIPTRQDSQGVSMCEAMSSGLIPITSYNTAIPEFVEHYKTGFLITGYKEISEYIKKIYEDENLFLAMSNMTSTKIQIKCGANNTINRELELILKI